MTEKDTILPNYEKYIKKKYIYDSFSIIFKDEYFSHFINVSNLYIKLFIITLSINSKEFLSSLRDIIFRFCVGWSLGINLLTYFKENKFNDIFENYFIDSYDKFRVKVINDKTKRVSYDLYNYITNKKMKPVDLFYKIIKKSKVFEGDHLCLRFKNLFYNFFEKKSYDFYLKNIIIKKEIEKEKRESLFPFIDKNYPFIYTCNSRESSVLIIEKKAFLKATNIGKNEGLKRREFGIEEKDFQFKIENLSDWDITDFDNYNLKIHDNHNIEFLNYFKEICGEEKYRCYYYFLVYIYFITIFEIDKRHTFESIITKNFKK